MAAYVAGDRDAFRGLFERVAPQLHGFFMRSFGSTAIADDLLQTTFLKVHRARQSYRSEQPLRPWLFTIAARVRADELRRRYRFRERGGDEALADAERGQLAAEPQPAGREGDLGEQVEAVRAALRRLPETQRVVLQLHRYEGKTFAEIGEMLGISAGAVKLRAFRAYEQLRKELRPLLESEAKERAP